MRVERGAVERRLGARERGRSTRANGTRCHTRQWRSSSSPPFPKVPPKERSLFHNSQKKWYDGSSSAATSTRKKRSRFHNSQTMIHPPPPLKVNQTPRPNLSPAPSLLLSHDRPVVPLAKIVRQATRRQTAFARSPPFHTTRTGPRRRTSSSVAHSSYLSHAARQFAAK